MLEPEWPCSSPKFDLGIGEEWLPKHPVARVSTSIVVLNQDNLTNNNDAEFWQSIGAIEDNKLIKVITDKQPGFPLEEVPSTLEPKLSKTSALPQSEACGMDVKPTKLSLLFKNPYMTFN